MPLTPLKRKQFINELNNLKAIQKNIPKDKHSKYSLTFNKLGVGTEEGKGKRIRREKKDRKGSKGRGIKQDILWRIGRQNKREDVKTDSMSGQISLGNPLIWRSTFLWNVPTLTLFFPFTPPVSHHFTPELIDAPLQVPCPSSCPTVPCAVTTFVFPQHLSYQRNSISPNPQSAFHTQPNRGKALRILPKRGPLHLHPRMTSETLVKTTHGV